MEARIALALCVALGSALCGRAAADSLRRRARMLKGLAEGIRVLRIHMTGMLEPVQDALERSDCPLFNLVSDGMRSGRSAGEAWEEVKKTAARRGGMADALTSADIAALDNVFERLGESGLNEQEAILTAGLTELERLRDEARGKAGEADRLYGTLGLLIGLMLALIVM